MGTQTQIHIQTRVMGMAYIQTHYFRSITGESLPNQTCRVSVAELLKKARHRAEKSLW